MTTRLPIAVTVTEDGGDTLILGNIGAKSDGFEVRLVDWSGWTDGPDIRANPVDVPGGDGAYDDDPLFSGRTVILSGVVHADTPEAMLVAQAAFQRLLARAGRRRGVVTVQQIDAPALSCRVRLGGGTKFKTTSWFRAEWSLSLYAAIPSRFAAEGKSLSTLPYAPSSGLEFDWVFPLDFGGVGGASGRIALANDGDIDAGVRLDINGACVNPQMVLVEYGERIAFLTTLTDGGSLSISTDTATRSVLRDGVAPWGFTMTSDSVLFLLRPGVNTLLFLTDSGTPTLTASWADTTP